MVWASKAVEMARKILSEPSIKALIEDLALLPDAEKLRRLTTLVNAKIKPLGRSSIDVAGIKMTVSVNGYGFIELIVSRKDCEEQGPS